MKRMLLLALAFASLAVPAAAQDSRRLLDSILIHSEAPFTVDRPIYRVFGFGGEYTDSIDYRLPNNLREKEVPGPPPSSLYVLFDAQHSVDPAWIDRDVRGVPDSVRAGTTTKFSLRYVLGLWYGVGTTATIVLPHALPAGIDSINFRDVIGGTGGIVLNKTITAGPDSVTAPSNLTPIAMIVYYDAADLPLGIREPIARDAGQGLRLLPNPAAGHVTIASDLAAGSRVLLSDLRGTALLDDRIAEPTDGYAIALDGLADGMYFVRALSPDGAVVNQSRLIVRH